MLTRLDNFIIAHHGKKSNRPFQRFANSKAGYLLTTFFAIQQSILEGIDKMDEDQPILSTVFFCIGGLISLYAIRHIFFKKHIEPFEYRMKVFEAGVILYAGFERWNHLGRLQGYDNLRSFSLPFFTVILFLFYLLIARVIFLKHKGKLAH